MSSSKAARTFKILSNFSSSSYTQNSRYSVCLPSFLWKHILEYINTSTIRHIFDMNMLSRQFKLDDFFKIKPSFQIDNQSSLDACINHYNMTKPKDIVIFLNGKKFSIPEIKFDVEIYGCSSYKTSITSTITINKSNCKLVHLKIENLNDGLNTSGYKIVLEDCLISHCLNGIKSKDSEIKLIGCDLCYNTNPISIKSSQVTLNNCNYFNNVNNINRECSRYRNIYRPDCIYFHKDCKIFQEGNLLTRLEHDQRQVTYDHDCEGRYVDEEWYEREFVPIYNNENKTVIFFTYIPTLSYRHNYSAYIKFHFGFDRTTIMNDGLNDSFDIYDEYNFKNNCKDLVTFSEDLLDTNIFRKLVQKIFANMNVEKLQISELDNNWFPLLKMYYTFLNYEPLKWVVNGPYTSIDYWKVRCSSYNLDNSLKPFWEHFKIHQAEKLFKNAGFFVKDGYLFLKKPRITVKMTREVDNIFYDSIQRKQSYKKKRLRDKKKNRYHKKRT